MQKNNEQLRATWRKYREEMISQCGIAIYMFGNKKKDEKNINANGIKEEFNIAESYQLVNIPLAFTGSMAQELYSENVDMVEKNLNNDEIEYITKFYDIDTNVDKIIKMINRLNNKEEC